MRRPGRHRGAFVRLNEAELSALRAVAYRSGFDSPAAWVRSQVERERVRLGLSSILRQSGSDR